MKGKHKKKESSGNKTEEIEEFRCGLRLCESIKKFSVDGTDGLGMRWEDPEPNHPSWKLHSGGASVMVWVAFAKTRKGNLVILDE